MKESLKDQQEKYFKYNFSARFTSSSNADNGGSPAGVVGFDGFYRFQMPPLSSLGFTQNYQACLCKVRKVLVSNLTHNTTWRWARNSDNTTINLAGGINVLTNLASRNIAFMGTNSQAPVRPTNDNNPVLQRLGVVVPDCSSTHAQLKDATTDPIELLSNHQRIIYEDNSDIKCSGTLTSVPFGQELSIVFSPAQQGASVLPMYPAKTGNQDLANAGFSVEMEFMMIES